MEILTRMNSADETEKSCIKGDMMTARNRVGMILLAAVALWIAPSIVNAAERVVLGEYFTSVY